MTVNRWAATVPAANWGPLHLGRCGDRGGRGAAGEPDEGTRRQGQSQLRPTRGHL